MKRSEINNIMREADALLRARQFYLPPFAYWTPAEWRTKGPEVAEIVNNHLGWDITDFGSGDFERTGLFLFTIRNGSPDNLHNRQGKLYAEKIMVVRVGQVTPMHFHWQKTEDIINRGGGRLAIQLYNANEAETCADTPVVISVDGVQRQFEAGAMFELHPGESITLPPRCYHSFWGVGETVLVGEVSMVNDDACDNCFLHPVGRFPAIEEDEEPLYPLCTDYARCVMEKR